MNAVVGGGNQRNNKQLDTEKAKKPEKTTIAAFRHFANTGFFPSFLNSLITTKRSGANRKTGWLSKGQDCC